MKKISLLVFLLAFQASELFSQSYPWGRPLSIAWSSDGINFSTPETFQDSSGVPSVIKWKGDTLICAFQWFRQPQGSETWDQVAVKFSYDNGVNWTEPEPIVVNGLPANYQRPFDPTLVRISDNSIRIYYSSSDGLPVGGGLDSTVNTYSALSSDGINYTFEANARVDDVSNKIIDPAVVFFNNSFQYMCPAGAPQDGAYHYISSDGLIFTRVSDVISDASHNWTGNSLVDHTGNLHFYGCGTAGIWYNSTSNGSIWDGYVNTNLIGGDPSVAEVETGNYVIIYVGDPYPVGLDEETTSEVLVYPNPVKDQLTIEVTENLLNSVYTIFDPLGKIALSGKLTSLDTQLEVSALTKGIYLLQLGENAEIHRFVKE